MKALFHRLFGNLGYPPNRYPQGMFSCQLTNQDVPFSVPFTCHHGAEHV